MKCTILLISILQKHIAHIQQILHKYTVELAEVRPGCDCQTFLSKNSSIFQPVLICVRWRCGFCTGIPGARQILRPFYLALDLFLIQANHGMLQQCACIAIYLLYVVRVHSKSINLYPSFVLVLRRRCIIRSREHIDCLVSSMT